MSSNSLFQLFLHLGSASVGNSAVVAPPPRTAMSLASLKTRHLRFCKAMACRLIHHQQQLNCSSMNSSSVSQEVKSSTSEREAGTTQQKSVIRKFWFSPSFNTSPVKKTEMFNSMLLYTNFINTDEESTILAEIEPYLSRLHYESSHWDDAIHEYRETERSHWNQHNAKIIDRIRSLAFPPEVPQLKLVHILDLAKKGIIKPHIDSARFCGNTIAGLSLLSDCVMRLRHEVQTELYCDVLLPRCSLYIMNGTTRYEFTHEILGESDSTFNSERIQKDRRISIICRNEPEQDTTDGPIFTTTGHLEG